MSARYYAQRHGGLIGPFPTYTRTVDDHAQHVRNYTAPVLADPLVLLDMGSLGAADMLQVLSTDPALRAVYELGRQQGLREGRWLCERR